MTPAWFSNALIAMVRDQDGDDPWPGAVEAFRQPHLWPPTLPVAYSPTGAGPVGATDFWAAFKLELAHAIAGSTIAPRSLASWTGLIGQNASAESADGVLRGVWYDLCGFEPIPGAISEVPYFLPGYSITGYTLFLEMQKADEIPLTRSQQDWIRERGLVWMPVPDPLIADIPSHGYLNPAVLDEAVARVELGWLRKI